MPASVTTAMVRPASSSASTLRVAADSVWSLTTSSFGFATPACSSSRPVRRVSSQAIRSAVGERLDGPRRELGEVSDRRRDEDERGSGHSTTSSCWPTLRFQRANAPASASTTERAEKHGSPTR